MTEFAPPGKKVKMTKAQLRKYKADLEAARKAAQAKLDAAKASGELDQDARDLAKLEEMLDDVG